jgi:GGDEF domain-containing protein
MISIRSLIDFASREEDSTSLQRACSLLMEGIALHSVSRDPGAHEAFRDAVRGCRRSTEESKTGEGVLVAAGRVMQLQEANAREVETFIRNQTRELQEMVRMLSETLIAITEESVHATSHLGKISKELETASRIDDLRQLKGRLQTSLHSIVAETARQKDSAKALSLRLRDRLSSGDDRPDALDKVTGLPDAACALRALASLGGPSDGATPTYVVTLCMERLTAINARFGYAMGDRLLFSFAQEAAQRFTGGDRLFRWHGPTVLAVLERPGTLRDVRVEATRVISAKHEQTIDWEGRSVVLSVAARILVIALEEHPSLETLVAKINSFVSPEGAG